MEHAIWGFPEMRKPRILWMALCHETSLLRLLVESPLFDIFTISTITSFEAVWPSSVFHQWKILVLQKPGEGMHNNLSKLPQASSKRSFEHCTLGPPTKASAAKLWWMVNQSRSILVFNVFNLRFCCFSQSFICGGFPRSQEDKHFPTSLSVNRLPAKANKGENRQDSPEIFTTWMVKKTLGFSRATQALGKHAINVLFQIYQHINGLLTFSRLEKKKKKKQWFCHLLLVCCFWDLNMGKCQTTLGQTPFMNSLGGVPTRHSKCPWIHVGSWVHGCTHKPSLTKQKHPSFSGDRKTTAAWLRTKTQKIIEILDP